jgi:hypothetical protein
MEIGIDDVQQLTIVCNLQRDFNFDCPRFYSYLKEGTKEEVQTAVEEAHKNHPGLWQSTEGRSMLNFLARDAIQGGQFQALRFLVEDCRVAVNTPATPANGLLISATLSSESNPE